MVAEFRASGHGGFDADPGHPVGFEGSAMASAGIG
jgi:hypothetical protein